MNIIGMVKNAALVGHAVTTGNMELLGASVVKTGLSTVPGANLVLGKTVDNAFGVTAAMREELFQTELGLHKVFWRQELDSIGDQDGHAELEDIGVAAANFVGDALNILGDV